MAAFGQANGLLAWGSFSLASEALRRVELTPADDPALAGMLTLTESLIAAAENRPADVEAALDQAAELAERTGETNEHWMSFGPTGVTMWRMSAAWSPATMLMLLNSPGRSTRS